MSLYVVRELAGSPPRSRRGNGGLSSGRHLFWPCTCRGSAERTGAVAGNSADGAGGDPVFFMAGDVTRDSVGGADGDPVVAVAGEAASDSTGGAGGDPVVAVAGEATSDSTSGAGGDPVVVVAGKAGDSVAVGGRRR